jgi:hypothetical protein
MERRRGYERERGERESERVRETLAFSAGLSSRAVSQLLPCVVPGQKNHLPSPVPLPSVSVAAAEQQQDAQRRRALRLTERESERVTGREREGERARGQSGREGERGSACVCV